ncbi:MAG: hypothetical protein IKL22_02260 [Lachnospiraceae bacterium]|nr:hypothetical protein [Lachnospiraceae bacterium]
MNKTTNKGYNVDLVEKKIVITKAFAKAAGVYGTAEFEAFVGLRNAFPDFKIEYKDITKNKDKVSYSGLSISKMRAFMQMKHGEEALVSFDKFVRAHEGEKGKYAVVKKAFLNMYKEEYNALTTDEVMELDILASELPSVA